MLFSILNNHDIYFIRCNLFRVYAEVGYRYYEEYGTSLFWRKWECNLTVRNSSKAIDQRVDALIDTVKYQASPNSGLSNGDTVHIVAGYDKEVAKQYKFRIKETSKDITVEGLPSQYPNWQPSIRIT